MTIKDIESSLYTYLISNLTGIQVDLNQPSVLDPDKDEVTKWVELYLTTNRGVPSRRGEFDYVIGLQVEANSRSQTDQYEAQKLLDQVHALVYQKAIPVHAYETSGKPIIGYIYFKEGDVTQSQVSGAEQWQLRTLAIMGHARKN